MANNQTAGPLALAKAETYLGNPYRFGGLSHNGIDCSGLELEAYAAEGIPMPHSTYLTYLQHQVALRAAWFAGDGGYIMGSDPGPNGQPGHVGLFKGIGVILDYSGLRHHFTPNPKGQLVFLNAPFTGDLGGVRYDYFAPGLIVAHTRPELALPNPPPLPALVKASKTPPSAAALKQCDLVAIPDIPHANLANKNGYTLWYWGVDGHFHPQVSGKPTNVTLYARVGYQHPPAKTTSVLLEWAA